MKINFTVNKQTWSVNTRKGISLAILLRPNGEQPNHFGAPACKAKALEAGDFIGDTRQGGSCNVSQLTMTTHCNGTHTESVSHIIDQLIPPASAIHDQMFPVSLITVTPKLGNDCEDEYLPSIEPDNRVICKQQLETLLADINEQWLQGLIVRTLPNTASKKSMTYDNAHYPPFFSNDAIRYLLSRGVQHLLVDFPSIDKMYDGGMMSNHHLFWQIESGSHQANSQMRDQATVTEMIYVDDTVQDGLFLCQLSPAAIVTDAVPTNPILYAAEPAA